MPHDTYVVSNLKRHKWSIQVSIILLFKSSFPNISTERKNHRKALFQIEVVKCKALWNVVVECYAPILCSPTAMRYLPQFYYYYLLISVHSQSFDGSCSNDAALYQAFEAEKFAKRWTRLNAKQRKNEKPLKTSHNGCDALNASIAAEGDDIFFNWRFPMTAECLPRSQVCKCLCEYLLLKSLSNVLSIKAK